MKLAVKFVWGRVAISLLLVLGSCLASVASGNVGGVSGPIEFSADVFFEPSSVVLEPSKLESLAIALKNANGIEATELVCVYIDGNSSGTEAAPDKLSAIAASRAQAVADWIRVQVGANFVMTVTSRGASRPAVPPPDQRNARVDVSFIWVKGRQSAHDPC